MKKAIITGATSFIGLHLIDRLISENWYVYAIIRANSEKIDLLPDCERVEKVFLEMNEYKALDEYISEPCDAYVSLAWNGTRGKERSDESRQKENFLYSMEALRAIERIGCNVVISAGSQAEYGLMTEPIDEEFPCNPNTAYGKWKWMYYKEAFQFCRSHGMAFKEPRFFSLYGEDDNPNTMIQSIIRDMIEGKECKLTKGIQLWNFLYIDDAVEGVYRLMTVECEDGAYNFGSDDTRQLKNFIIEMQQIMGSKSVLQFGLLPYPISGLVNVCPKINKLQNQTGWCARVSFREGIERVMKYCPSSKSEV